MMIRNKMPMNIEDAKGLPREKETVGKTKCYCVICDKYIGEYWPSLIRQTCSDSCYRMLVSQNTGEELNPNFGHEWSELQKEKARTRSSQWHKDHKEEFLEINRNREWSEIGLHNIGKYRRGKEGTFAGKSHSEETKKIIGIKSAAKWTPEFRQKFSDTMIERGYWRPRDERDAYETYRDLAQWKKRMWDLFPENEKLKSLGVFNSKSNPGGCVRDHLFSRSSGFREGVFPVILRHPANCQILTVSENLSKAHRWKEVTEAGTVLYDDAISLEELFNRINQFNQLWFEQDECLTAIDRYRRGERFSIGEVI